MINFNEISVITQSIKLFTTMTLQFNNLNSIFIGPYPWPIFGNLKLLRKLSKQFGGQHIAFLKLAKQYNSDVISLRLGTSRVIVVCGFETVQKILRDENFDARPWNEFVKIRNMGLRKGL